LELLGLLAADAADRPEEAACKDEELFDKLDADC
jgi:hypothetical protein